MPGLAVPVEGTTDRVGVEVGRQLDVGVGSGVAEVVGVEANGGESANARRLPSDGRHSIEIDLAGVQVGGLEGVGGQVGDGDAVWVEVGVLVVVGETVGVGVAVPVVSVGLAVAVAVGSAAETAAEAVSVGVAVAQPAGMVIGVNEKLGFGEAVRVGVAVDEGLSVAVAVGTDVGAGVKVGVAPGVPVALLEGSDGGDSSGATRLGRGLGVRDGDGAGSLR
jgi:hypothetical protein